MRGADKTVVYDVSCGSARSGGLASVAYLTVQDTLLCDLGLVAGDAAVGTAVAVCICVVQI